MKIILALVFLLVSGAAAAEDFPPAEDYLFISQDCKSDADPEWCTKAKTLWKKDYELAIRGDYQGQRNVAFCLSSGCVGSYRLTFIKNPILGCAWRIVILKSGHLKMDDTDTSNFSLYCGDHYVDEAGRTAAQAQAKRIMLLQGFKID